MLRRHLFASTLALSVAAGCGGNVSSSTSGTGGGTTTTMSTGGSGGAGGSSTGGTGGQTTTSMATGGGGMAGSGGTGGQTTTTTTSGTGGCEGSIELAVDNGAAQKLTSTCNGYQSPDSTQAQGYAFSGGAVGSPSGVRIIGCQSVQPNAFGVIFQALMANGVGMYTKGSTTFIDQAGNSWGVDGDPFQMTITKYEPSGGVIEGTFNATATHGGNAAHSLTGSFHVCHVQDLMAP
jgi:hypothetical protein